MSRRNIRRRKLERQKAKCKAIDAVLMGRDLVRLSRHFGRYHVLGWKYYGVEIPKSDEDFTAGLPNYICQWAMDPPVMIHNHPALNLQDALLLIDAYGQPDYDFTTDMEKMSG